MPWLCTIYCFWRRGSEREREREKAFTACPIIKRTDRHEELPTVALRLLQGSSSASRSCLKTATLAIKPKFLQNVPECAFDKRSNHSAFLFLIIIIIIATPLPSIEHACTQTILLLPKLHLQPAEQLQQHTQPTIKQLWRAETRPKN